MEAVARLAALEVVATSRVPPRLDLSLVLVAPHIVDVDVVPIDAGYYLGDVDDALCSNDDDKFEQSFSEPCSPDSGFSSDDGEPLKGRCRLDRAKTLPSALRRSRSKQCEKRVRFADALGLDLEKLQYFVKEENPIKALAARNIAPLIMPTLPDHPAAVASPSAARLVLSNFCYRSDQEHNDRTRESRISVTALRAAGTSVVGQVNLLNIAFDKKVTVRYTTNKWGSHEEVVATYSHKHIGADDIDAFNFTIVLPAKLSSGTCEFCVLYAVDGDVYWDNNGGHNYHVEVIEDPVPSSGRHARCNYESSTVPGSLRRPSLLPPLPPPPPKRNVRHRRWGLQSTVDADELDARPLQPLAPRASV